MQLYLNDDGELITHEGGLMSGGDTDPCCCPQDECGVDFDWTGNKWCRGNSFEFRGFTTDPGLEVAEWEWNLIRDGEPLTGPIVQYSFPNLPNEFVFGVTLTITLIDGKICSVTKPVTVPGSVCTHVIERAVVNVGGLSNSIQQGQVSTGPPFGFADAQEFDDRAGVGVGSCACPPSPITTHFYNSLDLTAVNGTYEHDRASSAPVEYHRWSDQIEGPNGDRTAYTIHSSALFVAPLTGQVQGLFFGNPCENDPENPERIYRVVVDVNADDPFGSFNPGVSWEGFVHIPEGGNVFELGVIPLSPINIVYGNPGQEGLWGWREYARNTPVECNCSNTIIANQLPIDAPFATVQFFGTADCD